MCVLLSTLPKMTRQAANEGPGPEKSQSREADSDTTGGAELATTVKHSLQMGGRIEGKCERDEKEMAGVSVHTRTRTNGALRDGR